MKNKSFCFGICFFGILFFSANAFAYDDLLTNDAAKMTETGKINGSLGFVYLSAGKTYNSNGKTVDLAKDVSQLRIPFYISYGMKNRFNLFAILPYVSLDNGIKTTSGMGDIWLGIKYRLLPDDILTLRGTLDIAADSDDASGPGNHGGPGSDFAIMTMKTLKGVDYQTQAGLRFNGEDEDKFAPGTTFYIDTKGVYTVSNTIRCITGIQFKTTGDGKIDGKKQKNGNNSLDISLGAAYLIGSKLTLRSDVQYTIAGKRSPQDIGIVVSIIH